MTRRLLPLLVALAVVVAACGGSGAEEADALASLDDGAALGDGDDALAATTDTTEPEDVTFEEAQLELSACMRETYPQWPDPDPDAGGGRLGFDPQTLEDLGLDLRDGDVRDVLNECSEAFAGVVGGGQERTAEEQAELEDTLLELFACVREVPRFEDLPDPDVSAGGGFGLRGLFDDGDIDPQALREAMVDCQAQLGIEGLGGPGGGRGGGGPGGGGPGGGGPGGGADGASADTGTAGGGADA